MAPLTPGTLVLGPSTPDVDCGVTPGLVAVLKVVLGLEAEVAGVAADVADIAVDAGILASVTGAPAFLTLMTTPEPVPGKE